MGLGYRQKYQPGLEVINWSSFSESKSRAMIGCLRTPVHKQPIIALYLVSENEPKGLNISLFGDQKPLNEYFFCSIVCPPLSTLALKDISYTTCWILSKLGRNDSHNAPF